MNATFMEVFIGVVVVLVVIAWSPWITKNNAEKKVVAAFEKSQMGIADGCSMNCNGCGITTSRKIPFGYTVSIEYMCGPLPDTPKNHQKGTRFVSFVGTVH